MRTLRTLVALFILSLPTFSRAADPAPAPFEKDIRAFEESDAKQAPPKDAILFIGSSSIRLWKSLEADFPHLKVINRGFGGSQIADSVRYADRIVVPYRPKLIVFYAGGNDVAAGKSPNQVLADFQAFVAKVRSALPGTKVLFVSIRPSVARRHLQGREWLTNKLVRDFTDADPTSEYVDVVPVLSTPDGAPRPELLVADELHLNENGYRAWTKVIRPRVEQALAGERSAQ